MKRNLFVLYIFFLIQTQLFGQSTLIQPGTILPQVTSQQRLAITSPNGILVFDSITETYWYLQNGNWVELSISSSTQNYWQLNGLAGNEIKNTNAGSIWSANPTGLNSATVSNSSNPPTAPTSGDGTRLMWIPSRSAFRVGTVDSGLKSWDKDSVGLFSTAFGINTKAKGFYSTSFGRSTTASGLQSTAFGRQTEAKGLTSTAFGFDTEASGNFSTALGYSTLASGTYSTAFGYETIASGSHSISMGNGSRANGISSIASGYQAYALGNLTHALGNKVSTNNFDGSFIIGDVNDIYTNSTSNNQFTARFKNGYVLMTSGSSFPTGVQIQGGQSAWSSISDSTRKENLVLADGEVFLQKLRDLRLGSWNYKSSMKNQERFYGPMAQEIFAAYGKDKYGTIGSDTLVSTINLDGLLFIYAQALEKRTAELQREMLRLETTFNELKNLNKNIQFKNKRDDHLDDRNK